jgi:hypothetical protein
MNLTTFKRLSYTSDKIYKSVRQNLRTKVRSSLYQKSSFLPVAIVFTYLCLLADAIKYPGFIGNHFFIDAKVYFALTIVLFLFSAGKARLSNTVLKINRFLVVLFTLIYLVLIALEGAHYTNYVLATYHIHLDGLVVVVLFGLSLVIAERLRGVIPGKIPKMGILYPAMVFFLALFMVQNMAYISNLAVNADSYAFFHLKNSYDDKMYYQWGDFYRFMVFVRNNTPADAKIVISPMKDPWLIGSGNLHFVRAFLYPREIIQYQTKTLPVESFSKGTFLLISWGQRDCKPDPDCHGWPRQNIAASKIIYKDPNSANVIKTVQNSIYTPADKQYVYGLIEL